MSEDRQGLILEAVKRGLLDQGSAGALLTKIHTSQPEVRPADAADKFGTPSSEPQGIWDTFKSYISKSGEDLARGAKEVGRDTLQLASDVGESLMPTQAGAQAGGNVLSKLGDIGQFASGGLQGPLGQDAPRVALGGRMAAEDPSRLLPQARPGQPMLGRGTPPQPMMQPQRLLPPPREAPMSLELGPGKSIGKSDEGIPLIDNSAKDGQPSMFAAAMLSNDPLPIDRALTKRFRRLTGMPSRKESDLASMTAKDKNITTAVDSIIDMKDNMSFTNEMGNKLPTGQLPRSNDQFLQAIDHLENQVYEAYDNLARGQTVPVPLAPAINRLTQAAGSPELRDLSPNARQKLIQQAQRWSEVGAYSPKEMQNVVQELTKKLKGKDYASAYNRVMANVLGDLRTTLDQTMTQALEGPQYQNLKNRYGALASIKKDVANALQKEMAKRPGGLTDKLMEPIFWANAIHGVITMDPTAIGRAAALGGAKEITKYLNSANRAVTKMFAKRAESTPREVQRAILERNSLLGDRYNAARTSNLDEYNSLSNRLREFGPQ